MGSYQMNIGAGVTGVEQIERLGTATDKQTERTKRVDEAIKAYASSNDKLTAKLLDVEKAEVRLEQLREQHRMQNERLAASTDKQTVSQERLNGAMRSHVTDVQAASASIRAFEGNLPIRAVEQFTTKILGLGPLMQAAFPIVGAVALVEALEKGGEKLLEHIFHWKEIKKAEEEARKELQNYSNEARRALENVRDLQQQLYTRQNGPLAGAQRKAVSTGTDAVTADKQAVDAERRSAAVQKIIAFERSIPTGRPTALPSQEDLFYAGQAGFNLFDDFREKNPRLYPQMTTTLSRLESAAPALAEAARKARAEATGAGVSSQLSREDVNDELQRKADEAERKADEAAKKVQALEAKIHAFEVSMFDRSNPIAKIFDQRDDLVRAGVNPGRATDAALAGAAKELAHEQGIVDRQTIDVFGKGQKALDKLYDEWAKEQNTDLNRGTSSRVRELLGQFDDNRRIGTRSAQLDLRNVRDNERRSLSLMRVSGQLSGQSERDQVEGEYGARIRFAGQEYQAELRLADLKKTDAEKDAARADALDQKNQKIFDAQMEREKAILEMILRQKQEFERNFVGLIHAAASGHLGRFVLGRLESLGDEILVKVAGKIFDRISKRGSGTISIPDVLGGAAKTQVDSTTDNTRATDDNTKALQDLTNVLLYGGASAGGGGRATIGFPSGSNGPGVMGGSSSTIMYGFPGSGGGSGSGAGGLGMDAAMVGGGAVMLASGIKQGGAKGDLQAASGGAMAAGGALAGLAALGAIAPMFAAAGPIGMAVAGALEVASLVAGMFGGGPEKRSREISNSLTFGRHIDPVSVNAAMTTYGGYADYDRFGGIRGSNLSPFPITQAGYRDPFNGNTIVPGRTTGQFGGGPNVTVHVTALDAKSIVDRHQDIGDAIVMAIDRGHTGLQEKVRGF